MNEVIKKMKASGSEAKCSNYSGGEWTNYHARMISMPRRNLAASISLLLCTNLFSFFAPAGVLGIKISKAPSSSKKRSSASSAEGARQQHSACNDSSCFAFLSQPPRTSRRLQIGLVDGSSFQKSAKVLVA
ncbi:unnamed protein product [Amoebophrya sp. A25]|nr:unnamed protein product [Amoebophrya sp. A25]|eukprot:GSA25T00018273001.1